MNRISLKLLIAVAAALTLAPNASAAERWASSSSSATSGSCTSVTPCRIDFAVNSAAAGDEIIVMPGTYTVSTGLSLTAAGASIRGQAGHARPTLRGTSNLGVSTLLVDAASTASHLRVESQDAAATALELKGASLGENLIVTGAGDGAKIVTEPGDTVLRDSVVVSSSTGGGAALKLRDGPKAGNVVVRNVTAWATSGTSSLGVRCETVIGQSSIVNTIVRGVTYDVDATTTNANCSGTNVNVRLPTATKSPGLQVSNGQGTEPVFVDAANLDFRVLSSSPTVDAGTTSGSWQGTTDLAGVARVTGSAPDIGAYEYDPATGSTTGGDTTTTGGGTTTTGGEATTTTGGETTTTTGGGTTTTTGGGTTTTGPAPTEQVPTTLPTGPAKLGRSVVLDTVRGTVLVRLPGSAGFVALSDVANLPVRTVIDATRGAVTLSTALPGGRTQTGTFGGGHFQVRQAAGSRGMTDIYLRGGSFARCRTARGGVTAMAASHSKRTRSSSRSRKDPVRRLWAKDKGGRFRTHGANSVATVRGTRWVTEDRCEGTVTKVTEGAVDVRDKHRGTTIRVRAGRSILVRAPRGR